MFVVPISCVKKATL